MNKNSKSLKVFSLIIVFAHVCYYFFTRCYVPNIRGYLIEEMHLSASQLSTITAAFSFGYSVPQVLGGYLLDKFNFRYLSSLSLVLACIASYVFASTNSILIAEYSRYLLGFSFCITATGALKYFTVVWREQFITVSNILNLTVTVVGALASSNIIKQIMNSLGWRNFLKIYTLLGLILAAALFYSLQIMNNHKEKQTNKNNISFKESILATITLPGVIFPTIYCATVCGACYVLMDGIGNVFLRIRFPTLTPFYFQLPAILNMVGMTCGFVVLILLDKLKACYRSQMFFYGIICLAAIVPIAFFKPGINLVLFCFFLVGLSSSGQTVSFYWLKDNLQEKYQGLGFGLMNFISTFLGGAVVQKLVGVILDFMKKSNLQKGIPFYQGYIYSDILAVFKYLLVTLSIITLACAYFSKDNSKNK